MSVKLFFYFGLFMAAIGIYGFITNFFKLKVCKEQVDGLIRIVNKSFHRIEIPLQEAIYTVNGVEYSINLASAQKIPAGTETVTVCYNPANPKKSYILEDKPSGTMFLLFFLAAAVCMLIGLGVPWVSKQNGEIRQLVLVTVFFAVGLAVTAGGFIFMRHEKNLRRDCTSQVDGMISSEGHSVRYNNGKRSESYRPWYAYTVAGLTYNSQSNNSRRQRKFAEGQRVTVCYDPAGPRRSYISEEGASIRSGMAIIALGLIFMIPAAIVFIRQFVK